MTVEEHFKKRRDGGKNRHVYYRCTKSTKDPDCPERSITATTITEQILMLIEDGQLDDIEPTEKLFKRIEQHKRITSQLIKDNNLRLTERDHFRHYASYVLKQGTLHEQDDFVRGLNLPLFVQGRQIFRRYES